MTVLVFGFFATHASARCVTLQPSSIKCVSVRTIVYDNKGRKYLVLRVRSTR